MPIYLLIYLPIYLPTYLPTYSSAFSSTYLPTHLPTHVRRTNRLFPLLCTRSQQYTPAFMISDHGTDCWLAVKEGRKEVGEKKKIDSYRGVGTKTLYEVTAAY